MTDQQHPIAHCPPWSMEQRVAWLEDHLGQLWDEVWWHQLPWWRRGWYWARGFRSPLRQFYRAE
jgi:hypothetical protein